MKVFVATPAYDGRVHTTFAGCMLRTFSLLAQAGIPARWETLDGCCYLPVARNKLVRSFLQSDATDFVFIDSDVGWDPEGFMRMLTYDRDFVAGIVPFKTDKEGYPVNLAQGPDNKVVVDPETGLIEGTMVATAFMRVRENVFATLIRKYMDDLVVIERDPDGSERERYLNFFDCQQIGDRWWGEDARFCRLWTDLGGKIWVDPNIEFTHSGSKAWLGNYHEFLIKNKHA